MSAARRQPGSGGHWLDHALCRALVTDGGMTVREAADMFHPPAQERGQSYRDVGWSPDAALAVCSDCPVRDECLRDALAHRERVGVRGGVDLGDATRRRRARDRMKRPPVRCKRCGGEFRPDKGAGRLEYCSEACAAAAHRAQQRESRKRRRGKVEREAVCCECGVRFTFTGRPRKYCSTDCSGAAESRRRRHLRACAWCGTRFQPVARDQRTCGSECAGFDEERSSAARRWRDERRRAS